MFSARIFAIFQLLIVVGLVGCFQGAKNREPDSALIINWKPEEADGVSYDFLMEFWTFLNKIKIKNVSITPKQENVMFEPFRLCMEGESMKMVAIRNGMEYYLPVSIKMRLCEWLPLVAGSYENISCKLIYINSSRDIGSSRNEIIAMAVDGGPYYQTQNPVSGIR